jgi:Mg-chelatase subunit ChlD
VINKMNTSRVLVVGCMALLLWKGGPPSAASPDQQLQLRPAGPVHMVQREPGEPTPFFRMDLTIVDERQAPIGVEWSKDQKELKNAIEIDVKGHGSVHPFYVESPQATATPEAVGRQMMLVVDISGSMTRTMGDRRSKYEAAKEAINRFLQHFRDGVDHIAIVPFESHQVAARIKAGKFVSTKAEARQQIEELPRPREPYNTALYSATMAGLEVLESRKASYPSQQFQLIMLTDGKNDVSFGDDPGLLDGYRGLDAVVSKAREVKIPIHTVGFGKPRDLDEDSLRAMAWPSASNYFPAPDAERLEQALGVFKVVPRGLVDQLRMTFATDQQDWSTLKSLTFAVRFKQSGGRSIESAEIPWFCQPMTACPPEGTLTAAEIKALLEGGPLGNGKTFQGVVLRRLAILAVFSGGLAALWFIPLRLLWTSPRLSRPSALMGPHAGIARLPTSSGNPARALRPRAPGQGGQSPPSNRSIAR